MCAADFDYFLELNFLRIYLLESNVSIFENRKKYEITPAFCTALSFIPYDDTTSSYIYSFRCYCTTSSSIPYFATVQPLPLFLTLLQPHPLLLLLL